jgi:hypothetical protein
MFARANMKETASACSVQNDSAPAAAPERPASVSKWQGPGWAAEKPPQSAKKPAL